MYDIWVYIFYIYKVNLNNILVYDMLLGPYRLYLLRTA